MKIIFEVILAAFLIILVYLVAGILACMLFNAICIF